MNTQFVAIYKSPRTSKVVAKETLFEAQRTLLGIVKSRNNPDVPNKVKKEIKTYSDLIAAMRALSVNGAVDAFILPVRVLSVEVGS